MTNGNQITAPPQGSSKPAPDPSVLTTDALQREVQIAKDATVLQVAHEKELHNADVAHLHGVIELQEKLREEKFQALDREMALVERQRVEQKTDTKLAVDAALIAQKELFREQSASAGAAIAKSENAALEQMKTMNQTFSMALEGDRRVSNDLKERINLQEQALATHAAAQSGEQKGVSGTVGWILAGLMSLIAVITIILEVTATR